MLHGFGATPLEFENLYTRFNKTEYTIIAPRMNKNFAQTLQESSNEALKGIKHHIKTWKLYKKLSIIGNSLGGLVAKLLIVDLEKSIGTGNENIVLENFITLVTPHHGILGPFSIMNTIRVMVCALVCQLNLSRELLFSNIVEKTETSDFKRLAKMFTKRVSYTLSTFDTMVPFWSSTFQQREITLVTGFDTYKLNKEDFSYKATHIENDAITTVSIYPARIETGELISNEISWKIVFVPIHSWLNPGNMVGKHLNNSWITPDKQEVSNSMNHIVSQFK
jgi:hypothetical protein